MVLEDSISWLSAEFNGPYTPAENLLILSSAFSIVASLILEILLCLFLRQKSKRKLWARYILYMILATNSALAFAAFLFASTDYALCEKPSSFVNMWSMSGYPGRYLLNIQTRKAENEVTSINPDGIDSLCGRELISRWLSLLISVFSTISLVSAWLDFREQDRRESCCLQSNEKLPKEKDVLLDV